jgi:serine/threonine protein kinase
MGIVYRAEHTIIGRPVAVKLLHPHLTAVPEAVDRFFREARAAAEVATDHVVQVTDSGGTEDGTTFLVMELLSGRSLRELLDVEHPLEIERAVRIALQVTEALTAVHDKGVIHRDLKPGNIQLVQRGEERDFVKLLDFGIAKIRESSLKLTQTGMILGSPSYMSPEQASSEPVDHRTDIYALGVILFEMLTGSVPFHGKTPPEILTAHAMDEPPAPRSLRQEIPEALEQTVLHCLAKDPEDRPPDMAELGGQLRGRRENGINARDVGAVDAEPDTDTALAAAMATTATGAQTMLERPTPTPTPDTSEDGGSITGSTLSSIDTRRRNILALILALVALGAIAAMLLARDETPGISTSLPDSAQEPRSLAVADAAPSTGLDAGPSPSLSTSSTPSKRVRRPRRTGKSRRRAPSKSKSSAPPKKAVVKTVDKQPAGTPPDAAPASPAVGAKLDSGVLKPVGPVPPPSKRAEREPPAKPAPRQPRLLRKPAIEPRLKRAAEERERERRKRVEEKERER